MAQAGQGPPAVYQPNAFDGNGRDDWRRDDRRNDRRDFRRDSRFQSQQLQISSGWFQRPYPYHLDYYKMRFSGPPYAGNLYGVPGVSFPPYYGPYYTGYGQPIDGGISATDPAAMSQGTEVEESTGKAQTSQPQTRASSETLPAPSPK